MRRERIVIFVVCYFNRFLWAVSSQMDLPSPEASWPVTVNYQFPNKNESCDLSQAISLSVLVGGLPGCHPTDNVNPEGYQSSYTYCPDTADQMTIAWFNDISCTTPAVTDLAKLGCQTNNQGEMERLMCYASFVESDIFVYRRQFSMHIALYRDDACTDDSFFMHQFIVPDRCISNVNHSRKFTPGSLTSMVRDYTNGYCSDNPESTFEFPINYCFPFMNDPDAENTSVVWGKILTLNNGDIVENTLPSVKFVSEPTEFPVTASEQNNNSPATTPTLPTSETVSRRHITVAYFWILIITSLFH